MIMFTGMSLDCAINSSTAQTLVYVHSNKTSLKAYKGNYFSIAYPGNFRINADEFSSADEASFVSPDNKVEFFVYSPLWGGTPAQYLKFADSETLIGERSEKHTQDDPVYDQKLIRRITLKARDGSYFRSFVHTRQRNSDFSAKTSELDLVFGIKYKDKISYDHYRDAYVRFKNALVQYAD